MCDGGSDNPSKPSESGAVAPCGTTSPPIKPSTATGWKYDSASGRWEKGHEEFRKDDMNAAQRALGDRPASSGRTQYERGCVGVTNSMAGWSSEDFSKSDFYESEAAAVAAAQKKNCGSGEKPKVFAVRYWDTKKDQRKPDADGKYPVESKEVYKAKEPGYVNFDFGYRQSDGSYIHANHSTPGMKVKISPTSKQFDNGYAGFNTVVYGVRCAPCD